MKNKSVVIYYGGFICKSGGVFSHVRAIESELIKTGWSVLIVTLDSLPIWCRYIPHILEKLTNLFNRPLGFLYKGHVTRALYKYFFETNADLRIYEDVYISWNSNIPSITIMHAVWSDNLQAYDVNQKQLNKLKKREIERINKIGHRIVTVSYPYLDYLVNEHFSGELLNRISVIELGVDQSKFKINTAANAKSIVYLGSLEARKNLDFLLNLFKKIKKIDRSFLLTIIGDGPDRNRLEEFSKKNALAVNFLGRLSSKEVLLELPKHGLYIHTSIKESFSYSLLEAKLTGLTTIAYDKLQVPIEFVDIGVSEFDLDVWCKKILDINYRKNVFDASRYKVEKMTKTTILLAS